MNFFKKRIITRDGFEDGEAYLIRWNLFECAWFSLKIHRILRSDEACLHDHPWAFLSIILKGGYVEERMVSETKVFNGFGVPDANASKRRVEYQTEKKLYGAGSILWRPASHRHRLEIFQPAVTLVLTLKKVQPWGFYTPQGWVPHWEYDPTNKCE